MADEEKYLSMAELTQRFGLTRYAFYKWMEQGSFPLGVHFGRAHRWPLSQIKAWEAERLNESARIHEVAAV